MHYEELPGPLTGWTYDDNGTVYTSSGYRCDARTIECALWLFECYSVEARRWLIRSDEAENALRPVYELSDLTPRQPPTRLRLKSRKAVLREKDDGAQPTRTAREVVTALRDRQQIHS